MADAPKLFGKPGTPLGDNLGWIWDGEPLHTVLRPLQFGWRATVRDEIAEEVYSRTGTDQGEVLEYVEEYLTRLAAALDAMGVPRAR